ncbi:hypothetical protein AB0I98_16705 [Streptomyces sp. NPDC050211]|uniref:hypothetical protein n=1 Tax=Streptomyces sp. NPDC050211 TaxID=3154932 RepID=UPI00341DAFFD
MAQNSWPSPEHNNRNVTDAEYEVIASRATYNGIYGDPTHDPVVSAGVGLNVTVRANVYGNLRGFAWYSGTTNVTLPVAANNSGQTRIDLVVLRLDRADWTVRAVVKQGTPGAGTPALAQDGANTGLYEIRLAVVTVLNGAASVTVTRNELYVGSRVRPLTSSTPNPVPLLGELGWETDTKRLRVWDGAARRTVYADSGVIVINASLPAWSWTADSVLEVRSGVVCLRLGGFQRKDGTLAADIPSRLPAIIPAAYRHPNRDQYGIAYVSGVSIGRFIVYSAADDERAGQVFLTNKPIISQGESVFPQSGISWVVD